MKSNAAEAILYVKQERLVGVAPPASSVSSVDSQMPRQLGPGTPSPGPHVHAASRFASGASTPVQFNGSPSINLNRTPKSGESCQAPAHKTRAVPEENVAGAPQPVRRNDARRSDIGQRGKFGRDLPMEYLICWFDASVP